MTRDEQDAEIASMARDRRKLLREIACLENKIERIRRALSEINAAIAAGQKLHEVRDEGIVTSRDGTTLPPVEDIMKAQNRLLEARNELAVLEERLDVC